MIADQFDYPDDETAFWREAREGPDHPQPPERECHPNYYGEWMASERRIAYTVMCPDCLMPTGTPCVRIDYRGRVIVPREPLRKLPAHNHRLQLARKAAP